MTLGQLIDLVRDHYPELRYGQIIANAMRAETGAVVCDPFYLDDQVLRAGLWKLVHALVHASKR